MRVICDTHIWYYLGSKTISYNKVKLVANFNNIDELSRTPWLINKPELVRNAIQSIFHHSFEVIYEPPLIFLKRLSDSNFCYDIKANHGDILDFTEKIANGYNIDESKMDDFKFMSHRRQDKLQEISDIWNKETLKVRENIKDKKKHRQTDITDLTHNMISLMVSFATESSGLPDNFDWTKIELFETTLKTFFIELELSKMKIQPNDWYDLMQFIYVQPDSKIWICEKKWINIITKAGMSNYLYENCH